MQLSQISPLFNMPQPLLTTTAIPPRLCQASSAAPHGHPLTSSRMPICFVPWKPNAGRQARRAAGAKRTLPAVACTRLFGAGSDTDTEIPLS